jgi:hypothetical protein
LLLGGVIIGIVDDCKDETTRYNGMMSVLFVDTMVSSKLREKVQSLNHTQIWHS